MNFRQRLKRGDGQLRLRLVFVATALIPLCMAVGAILWYVGILAEDLEQAQIAALKPILLQARRDEIKHFVQAGRRVAAHFCERDHANQLSVAEGLDLIRKMDFGEEKNDNYFFIYTLDGVSVMHPKFPAWEGTSKWDLKDKRGTLILQRLSALAREGGGFLEFYFTRPSTKHVELKLGYVEYVPECNWMIGTGLYFDQLRETEDVIKTQTNLQVTNTRDKIILIAFAASFFVACCGLALNLSGQRNANAKLRAMAQKVVLSQEAERTRVARELHDGVSQSLASVKYIFESADIQLDREKFEGASKAIKTGITQVIDAMIEVRRISHDLHPTILDDQGLGMALKQLAREFQSRTEIPVRVEISEGPAIQREAGKTLYRIAQQALGNIETHAHASEITLKLRQGNGIELLVKDNGIGFDVLAMQQQRTGGLGLVNMRERIDVLGGSFAVRSQPGETSVRAFLPPESIKV